MEPADAIHATMTSHSIPFHKILKWIQEHGIESVAKVMAMVPPNGFKSLTNTGLIAWIAETIPVIAKGGSVARLEAAE